ncbi:hypothetical protein P3T76_013591 [Phytophthora citrophthora]|uniref:Uncharacterized protein n=1 Tax=Phytophthora citrophthora TaxID=4793 RepID=A0AAD9G3Y6_9STRA|nr:hypothetical protein P3T76_013591 [Phytophthora citrophthora]
MIGRIPTACTAESRIYVGGDEGVGHGKKNPRDAQRRAKRGPPHAHKPYHKALGLGHQVGDAVTVDAYGAFVKRISFRSARFKGRHVPERWYHVSPFAGVNCN